MYREDGQRRRRWLLKAVGSGALVGGLAGCQARGPGDDGGGSDGDGGSVSGSVGPLTVTLSGVDPCQPIRDLFEAYHENSPVVVTATGTPGGDAAGTCGTLFGDPHVRTVDGNRYDFMGAGEFVALESTSDDLAVQVRMEPWGDSEQVSVLTAVAARVGASAVQVSAKGGDRDLLLVDGVARAVPVGEVIELDGGAILRSEHVVGLVWADGTVVAVTVGRSLDLTVAHPDGRAGEFQGLLGNGNGDAGDDLVTRGGEAVAETFEGLYGDFAADWRIDAESSLFAYANGESTATYTDRSFPAAPPPELDDEKRQAAERACFDAGVRDPDFLGDCVLDVGLTGDNGFAARAAGVQPRRATTVGTGPASVETPAALRRGDASRTGSMTVDGPIEGALEWSSEQDFFRPSMPVAGDSVVVVAADESVTALDSTDGTTRWSVSVQTPGAAPTVAGPVVYAPTRAGLLALSTADGTEHWRLRAFADEDVTSPVVTDGSVYASLEVDDIAVVVAADATTGALRWERVLGRGDVSAVSLADGSLFIAHGGTVVALNHEDGTEQWRTAAPFGVGSALAVADGTVYATGTNGGVVAFDAGTGQQRFYFEADFWWSAPAVDTDRVYAGSGDVAYGLDRREGSLVWERPTESILRDPIVAGGRVYATTQRGDLVVLDAAAGEEELRVALPGRGESDTGPYLTGDRLYVTGLDGNVLAYR
jgi:outer membrane protein assembly factor BamB